MKRTNYFTLAALAALCLAGCTQDDGHNAAGLPMTGTPMRVVAHVDAPVTREAMTTNDLTRYYFRVTDADGGTDEYNYFTTMTLENDQWTADQEMTWQSTFPKVSALEQKDVDWSETDYINGKNITLPTDQSTHDNLLKSDLLYMTPKTLTPADLDEDYNIKVNLAHLFAKLKVVVTVNGVPFNPLKSLTIGGTKTQAHFTPETGELGTVTGEATPITAYIEGEGTSPYTYECILLPQTVAASTLTITATLQDGTTKGYEHPEELELQGNCQYTLSLSMDHEGKLAPSGSVGVDGWGNEDIEGGELEEGAEISENGIYIVKNAKGLLEWAQAVAQGSNPFLTLTADIDMTGRTWPVIGGCSNVTIDGRGYTISNLTLTPNDDNYAGLIAGTASYCAIKNLTLWKPSITENIASYGFFVGDEAEYIIMENCHVVSGSCSGQASLTPGGLVGQATSGAYIACSVVSSNVGLFGRLSTPYEITACYVFGSEALGSFDEAYVENQLNNACYNSYYQETAGGSITEMGDNTPAVSSWSEAAQNMNSSLSSKNYEWIVNTVTDDDPRPLIIQHKTTE